MPGGRCTGLRTSSGTGRCLLKGESLFTLRQLSFPAILTSEKKRPGALFYAPGRFLVKSGNVPVQLELETEAALDAVLDFDVSTEVPLRVNVEGAVL